MFGHERYLSFRSQGFLKCFKRESLWSLYSLCDPVSNIGSETSGVSYSESVKVFSLNFKDIFINSILGWVDWIFNDSFHTLYILDEHEFAIA